VKLRFILTLFLFFAACNVFAQKAKQHLKAGEQFFDNGMVDAAIAEFNQSLQLDPNDGRTYSALARVLLVKGDSLQAADNFQRSAALGYDVSSNYLSAAQVYYQLFLTNKALTCINLGLESKPKDIDLLLLKCRYYFELADYSTTYQISDEAIKAKDMALAFYYNGVSAYHLGYVEEAYRNLEKAIIRDKNLAEAYLAIAKIQLEQEKYSYAIDNCTMVLLLMDPENIEALVIRSRAFRKTNEPDAAISDITKAIGLNNKNYNLILERAQINLDYALYDAAIHDYSIAISMNDTSLLSYKNRAYAYEQLGNKENALSDYHALMTLLNLTPDRIDLKESIRQHIYELGKETVKPKLTIIKPLINDKLELIVEEGAENIVLSGNIIETSELKELKVNNTPISFNKEAETSLYTFNYPLQTANLDFISITAVDIYNNISTASYPISYFETDAPVVELISPVGGGAGFIQLETDDNTLYIEGRILDKSYIKAIKIDEVNASFTPGDYNPKFTATIDIRNRKNITITATDAFGNSTQKTYEFAKDGYMLSNNNPMGKTWVVIIENTDYVEYTNLSGPEKDVVLLTDAFKRYQISRVLLKKNMTKRELERFFAIDLRDLILSNQVNSLLIWYAGHGQNVNGVGYWIPTDGRQNDEYSFYNINALKASLYSYQSLTHMLVVSDACDAGESFTIAMRGANYSLANCTELSLITRKSALVLTSSYKEAALDNSLFTLTFANALENNPADCIPIDAIAERISLVMYKNTGQKPVFGRIAGLEDKNGTFFFVTK
jgi:tetratricopeptide (TPR) repeat protein